MKSFYSPGHGRHDPGQLPQPVGGSDNYYSEVAARGYLLLDALRAGGFGPIIAPDDAGLERIASVHSRQLLDFLATAFDRMAQINRRTTVLVPENFAVARNPLRVGASIWAQLGHFCYDTSSPIFQHTWDAAYWSAQCAINAADAVAQGATTSYALCRPPGHHAGADLYGGFCYLNNAAIAAQRLVDDGARAAILDVDYHHGNGTQSIFYPRADVLFCSLHADPDHDYPFYWGYADETGAGPGVGYTRNLPLPLGCDESTYLDALGTALATVAAFAPDVLVISLGFDTFAGDPVGTFALTTESFQRIGAQCGRLGLPTVVVQEGGYARAALGANLTAFLTGLLDGSRA
ncbi:MAG: histone deacetylase family protein [Caldilineaceae bacterium]|nr:histone deacetylase family protein [Caldilineaceae bacterium]